MEASSRKGAETVPLSWVFSWANKGENCKY